MKSICFGVIAYVRACFAIRSVTLTFGSVNVSLFCGSGQDF